MLDLMDERNLKLQSAAYDDASVGDHAAPSRAADALARAQHLVDSRPEGEYPLALCIEAMHVGDLPAVVALRLSERVRSAMPGA
jgi:hypothetical protein